MKDFKTERDTNSSYTTKRKEEEEEKGKKFLGETTQATLRGFFILCFPLEIQLNVWLFSSSSSSSPS